MTELATMAVDQTAVDQIVDRFWSFHATVEDGVRGMAQCIVELDGMGVDPESLSLHGVRWLRRVASGDLLPGVFTKLIGNTPVLERVARLPPAEQERVVADEELEYAKIDSTGPKKFKCKAVRMTPKVASIVFYRGHIQTFEEQAAIIRQREPSIPDTFAKYTIPDRRRKQVVVTRPGILSVSMLEGMLKELTP